MPSEPPPVQLLRDLSRHPEHPRVPDEVCEDEVRNARLPHPRKQALRDKLIEHRQYITQHGEDMPEVREWTWPY